MKKFLVRSTAAAFAAVVLALSGCGGGGGDAVTGSTDNGTPSTPSTPGTTVSVAAALSTAAGQASNDTSANPTAAFSVLQGAGMPVVTVNSPPKVNFAVFSDGKLVNSVVLGSVSFALSKLVPGTNGEPDQWVNYVTRTRTSGANSAKQATTDPKQTDATLAAQQLVYNPDGYYTYTFQADIKNPAWAATVSGTPYSTNGVTFEPNRTHRIVIQLAYKNAAGTLVRVNPYFDFTLDANGNSVPVTDAAKTRKMVDIGTCNNCHNKLSAHGGGRVDTQFCVMCHNPGTTDATTGNNVNLATMVHKIHAGAILAEKGETYKIGNTSFADVGFPQPIRNCSVCHDGSNAKTPQGDNWKKVPSKEACLTCHQSGATSPWYATHVTTLKLGSSASVISNSTCASCHGAGTTLGAANVHWVQEIADAPLYQGKIDSVSVKNAATSTASGTLTVKYSVINPATGTAYDLREGCTGTWTLTAGVWGNVATTKDAGNNTITGCNSNYRWDANLDPTKVGRPTDKFGMFAIYLGTETVSGVKLDDATDTSSYTAYKGIDDGTHHYTAYVTIPAGSSGNARVLMIGAVSERRLDPVNRNPIGAVPAITNDDVAYVPVKNAVVDVNIATGATNTGASARRQIVSNDNCNKCHNILGLPMGADSVAFHKGHRNNSDACGVCHNANTPGSYTLMADGSTGPQTGDSSTSIVNAGTSQFLHESYQSKRFIHGIHYGEKRTYPFTHCMNVGGAYKKDGTNLNGVGPNLGTGTCVNQYPGVTDNFTAEVAYPGSLTACSNCHVNDSWKQDKSVVGSVVFKSAVATSNLDALVVSPKVATCTVCHDTAAVRTHVTTVGGGVFGTITQKDLLINGKAFEACEGCHAPGSAIGVDTVHANN